LALDPGPAPRAYFFFDLGAFDLFLPFFFVAMRFTPFLLVLSAEFKVLSSEFRVL